MCQASYQALDSLHLTESAQQLCVPKIPVSCVRRVRLKPREVKSVPRAHTAKSWLAVGERPQGLADPYILSSVTLLR